MHNKGLVRFLRCQIHQMRSSARPIGRASVASLSVGAAVLLAGGVCAPAYAADFYAGRTITVVVGYTAGGGYDVYARLLAKHMGRHIPGSPGFVVQNMPGAGSLKSANYLYGVAPKDGTSIGTFGRGTAMEPLLGNAAATFDAAKFTWLGSITNESSVCAAWHTSPVKSWDDMVKKGFTAAGEGAGSDPDIFAAVLKNVLGAKIKVITGYPGGAEMALAIERGEVDGRCGWSWTSIKSTKPTWIPEKKLNVLVQLALDRNPEIPDAPLVTELAKTEQQQQIMKLIFSRQAMGRPYAAPPGLPADRKVALRTAFDATMKDPAFVAEAKKQILEVSPVNGDALDTMIGDIYGSPKEVIQAARAGVGR
jgi:tripartite-type tricarboxylate transporter receptor subunit TctC